MRRRWVGPLATLAALVVTLAMAGCGVPGRSDVVVDGEGSNGYVEGGNAEGPPPGPEAAGTSVEEFVKLFLEAPAGDWDGAAKRVKAFLSPEIRATWQAPPEITVIRLISGKPDIRLASSEVVLKVQQIGVLTNRGILEPPTSQVDEYKFTVGRSTEAGGGLAVVKDAPSVMLLTDTELSNRYEQRTLYFWDSTRHNLVPDLRYVPRMVRDSAPNLLIDWLIQGPASWLKPAVQGLPDGTKQLARAYLDNGRMIVNLSNAVNGQSLDQLLAQLCWSLSDDFTGKVVLQVEYQKQREGSVSDYRNRNPAYLLTDRGAQQFAVANGVVHRVRTPGAPVPDDVPLDPADNKNVRSAAISDGFAALVRSDGDQAALWVGSTQRERLAPTRLRGSEMSRPVLADGQDIGYVAADGKLYQFSAETGKVTQMTVSGLPAGVTAIALAPDARRLAVVAGDRPYLLALGGDGGGSTVARPVPPPVAGLTGISWLSETSLAMTGTNRGRASLFRLSLDGGVILTQQELNGVSAVTGLVSFPEDPATGAGGRIIVEADNRTYEVYSSTIDPLSPEKLAGPPVKMAPVAPFFME